MEKCCCKKHIRIHCTDEMGDFKRNQIPDGHGSIYKGGHRDSHVPVVNPIGDKVIGYTSHYYRNQVCPSCPIHGLKRECKTDCDEERGYPCINIKKCIG